jgi:hypothetical protein
MKIQATPSLCSTVCNLNLSSQLTTQLFGSCDSKLQRLNKVLQGYIGDMKKNVHVCTCYMMIHASGLPKTCKYGCSLDKLSSHYIQYQSIAYNVTLAGPWPTSQDVPCVHMLHCKPCIPPNRRYHQRRRPAHSPAHAGSCASNGLPWHAAYLFSISML